MISIRNRNLSKWNDKYQYIRDIQISAAKRKP